MEGDMKKAILYGIFLILLLPAPGLASQPMDVMKGRIDLVLSILKDPKYKEPSQVMLQRDKIWEIIIVFFDFEEMSQRATAQYWKSFNREQKKVFSNLFAKLLGNAYIDKIVKDYKGEDVAYLSGEMTTEAKAVIHTKVSLGGIETKILYSMHRMDDTWKVYDVTIEGVSLVQNYRSQFSKILLNKTPAQLIDMLQKKLDR